MALFLFFIPLSRYVRICIGLCGQWCIAIVRPVISNSVGIDSSLEDTCHRFVSSRSTSSVQFLSLPSSSLRRLTFQTILLRCPICHQGRSPSKPLSYNLKVIRWHVNWAAQKCLRNFLNGQNMALPWKWVWKSHETINDKPQRQTTGIPPYLSNRLTSLDCRHVLCC